MIANVRRFSAAVAVLASIGMGWCVGTGVFGNKNRYIVLRYAHSLKFLLANEKRIHTIVMLSATTLLNRMIQRSPALIHALMWQARIAPLHRETGAQPLVAPVLSGPASLAGPGFFVSE